VTDYAPVESLTADHDRSTFDCGSDAQSSWLRSYAVVAQQADTARVYVIRPDGEQRVAGYYALAAGSIEPDEASVRLSRGTGRHPIPVVVLIRLGVDVRDQGRGLGSELVYDAFLQTAAIADRVGARALMIQAESPRAAAFYRRLDPAFEELPGDPLQIVLLMKDLRRAIQDAADARGATE
jgi:ribosomal protein S18 acetylase RimI-like enzyme